MGTSLTFAAQWVKISQVLRQSRWSNEEFLLIPELQLNPLLSRVVDLFDTDGDGYISNGELFQVLKMMVGTNLNDVQLQQIVDKTIREADLDGDGKISFEEFARIINTGTPIDLSAQMTIALNEE